jgi:hypothetical protein
MRRLFAVAAAVVLAGAVANAGQVTIGSNITYNGTTGVYQSQNGLTQAYLTGTATSCAGYQLFGNSCITSTAPTATSRNYDVTLFNDVVDTGNTAPPAPQPNFANSPFTGYAVNSSGGAPSTSGSAFSEPSGATITGGGTTFSMIADSANPTSDFWNFGSVGNTVTIPIGISGVSEVWTMLNDEYGLNGNTYSSITFNFGASSSNVTTTSVTVNLYEGTEIRDAVDCTTAGSGGTNSCTAFALTTASNTPNASLSGTNLSGLNNVTTANLYSAAYTGSSSGTSASGGYVGSAGNLVMDDQGFNFGSNFLSDYLVSISVTDTNASANVSRLGLSAVTINTSEVSATPEPSTWILFGAGLVGLLALGRLRKITN